MASRRASGPGFLDSLLEFPRSPLQHWGIRRSRRWMTWLAPPLFWLIAFVAILTTIAVSKTLLGGRPLSLASIANSAYWDSFLNAYLFILFFGGVGVPLMILLPWNLAVRFQKYWVPTQVRELLLTELTAFDIFWGVVLPPLRPLLQLAGTTVAFLGVLSIYFLSRVGPKLVGSYVSGGVSALEIVLVGSLLIGGLVVGFAQRRRYVGAVAFALGFLIGGLILAVLLWGTGLLYLFSDAGTLFPFLYPLAALVPLTAVQTYALRGVHEHLHALAGE